ncbi:serpentine type 7TM GPCR chemoreceptor srh domain-containing protein [Ditylenchus destructor]|nr:serpentine type 7TM GPCR chemoreceptor srh domain-containing protein [Ditylenchus destructor]
MQHTGPDYTFYESDFEPFKIKSYINATLAVLGNSLGFYLIWFRSPPIMGNYRYFLLNMMQASFILDMYLTVFMQPYPLMPISGYCILGLLTHAGQFWGAILGVVIMIEFLGICGASVLTAALYRLAAVYDWQKRMLTKRAIVFFVLAHIFLVSPLLIIAVFVIREVSDQEPIRRQVFYQYPGVVDVATANNCAFAPLENNILMKLAVCCAMVYTTQIMVIAAGSHSYLNSIIMIIFTKPYRQIVVGWIRPLWSKEKPATSVVQPSSSIHAQGTEFKTVNSSQVVLSINRNTRNTLQIFKYRSKMGLYMSRFCKGFK